MSVQALSWALEDAPDVPTELVAVLVGLANHADERGRHAYPSLARLARYSRKSSRQVRRDLRDLEARGLIRAGDQRLVLHISAGQRPRVYDLAIERRCEPDPGHGCPPTPDTDVPPTPDMDVRGEVEVEPRSPASAPDTDVRSPRTQVSAEPSLNRPTTSVLEEGDGPARTRDEPASPPPAVGRAIPPEEKARLAALGDEARRATAAARAEAAARDTTAIAGCERCDEHGLLPTRVPCLHPREKPKPGTGRAEFAAARAALAARTQPCGSCSLSASACRDSRKGCCPDCTHHGAGSAPPDAGPPAVSAPPDPDPSHVDRVEPSRADPPVWTVCSTCGRAQRHLPGCPDDPANAPDPDEVLAVAGRIAAEDADLLDRLEPEAPPVEVWGPDDPPF